jgi:23S rRNA-/tRNA-specific pseudouridylate synthase
VVGDIRYGKRGDRMGLHALRLNFTHPVTRQKINLKVDAPADFYALLK